jgi:hypothetical protein
MAKRMVGPRLCLGDTWHHGMDAALQLQLWRLLHADINERRTKLRTEGGAVSPSQGGRQRNENQQALCLRLLHQPLTRVPVGAPMYTPAPTSQRNR